MSTISAGTTSTTTLIHSGDTTGSLVLKTNDTGSGGTTAVTIGTDQSFNFSATGQRITGDFSNATFTNRVSFQSSTTNGTTVVQLIPNGTSTSSQFSAYGGSDILNTSVAQLTNNGTEVRIASGIFGTGTYLPMAFYTGGSERMRIDTSGNVGIGTSSPNYSLEVNQSGGATIYSISDTSANIGAFRYSNDTGQAIVVTRKARGTQASPSAVQTNDVIGQWVSQAYGGTNWRNIATIETRISNYTSDTNISSFITFSTNNASTTVSERMRIDSSGNLLVGTTSQLGSSQLSVLSSQANQMVYLRNSNATPGGIFVNYSVATPNNTGSEFFFGNDPAQTRVTLRSNGGIANYSANNVNLSDRREKTNFAPAKSYLDVICAIPVQTFNYIDQNLEEDDGLTLGVVAQDVQAVAPELVSESDWSPEKDGSKLRLSIYQTDLQYALMKCIQEQQALIQQLQADVAALKGTS